MQILENISLAPLTTFGIGGPARWFAEAASEKEIVEATCWARDHSVPLFVLGGGSNVLIADSGFPGLVLHVAIEGIEHDGALFRVAAGTDWERCVQQALGEDCAGIECLAGIPGSVGGTPVQNVGAYGQEVSSVIDCVRAFDIEARKFVEFSNSECGFSYRRSRFNTVDRGRFIVTRVDYKLTPGGAPTLHYADLKAHLQSQSPTLTEVADAVREIRRGKGMLLVDSDPDCRSAGSFFKNPTVTPEVAERVRHIAEGSGLPLRTFPADGGLVKIPAAWLIEQTGFAKGFRMGDAGISSRHTLALINRGGAKAREIIALAQEIVNAVEMKFGIHLDREPDLVGF